MTNAETSEEIRDEVVDLEHYAQRGERPPRCGGYRIRVNGSPITVSKPMVTGREVLGLADLEPPEKYCLRLKVRGERPRLVGLDQAVDLTAPGVERFEAEERKVVTIKVNDQPVKIEGPKATGLAIKKAAIEAGLCIQLDFVLSVELPNGRTRIVGDDDHVAVHEGTCFIAVAPDDNS